MRQVENEPKGDRMTAISAQKSLRQVQRKRKEQKKNFVKTRNRKLKAFNEFIEPIAQVASC